MINKIIIQVNDLEVSRKQTIFHIEALLKSAQNSIKKELRNYCFSGNSKIN